MTPMNDMTFIFIYEPGVIGYIVDQYKETIKARYYLDGISYTVSLENAEFTYHIGGNLDE